MNRGDVVDVDLPSGPRPAVIVTRNSLIDRLSNVTVVEVTSTYREGITTVGLARPEHGLDRPSVANAVNVQTVPKSAVTHVRGSLDPDEVSALDVALQVALGLDFDPALVVLGGH